jgi:predicted CxxxxCH...CXXCH cytochrome family protein
MSKLRKSANGQNCEIRLPDICNGDSATVVLCHFRLSGFSGTGYKSPDWLGAFGCSSCHVAVDSDHSPATQLAFAHGVFRTIARQIENGFIKV